MLRHALPDTEVLITDPDPGRGHSAALTHALAAKGYAVSERRCRFNAVDAVPFRGRLLGYRRGALLLMAATVTPAAGSGRERSLPPQSGRLLL